MELGAVSGWTTPLERIEAPTVLSQSQLRSSAKPQVRAPALLGLALPTLGLPLGVLAGLRSRARGRPARLAPRLRYTAETTRVIGDWANGFVESGEVKLVVSELPGGITQFRSVHGEGSRYGEEYDLAVGSTENLYLIKAESKERPWLLIGAFSSDSRSLISGMVEKEPGLADKIGVLMLQFFDGGQAPGKSDWAHHFFDPPRIFLTPPYFFDPPPWSFPLSVQYPTFSTPPLFF